MSPAPFDSTAVPDLLESAEHEQLRAALRDMLAAHCTTEQVLAGVDAARTHDPDLWRRVAADLGLAGLLIPEEFSGDGASAREAAIVAEELGRACAPAPYLASAVLATVALVESAHAGSGVAAAALPGLAGGHATAALLVPATQGPLDGFPGEVGGTRGSDGPRGDDDETVVLTGSVRSVLGAHSADTLVVPALVDGVPVLALVDAPSGAGAAADAGSPPVGLLLTTGTAMDATRPVSTVDLESVPGRVLVAGTPAEHALSSALRTGAAMLAAEQVGVADWALDTACEYLRVRHQFGRPIGSYQSLRHRAARMWIALGQARATVRYAAAALAEVAGPGPHGPGWDDEASVAVALASAHACRTSLEAVEDCLQMHGGIGFTWEHPLHLRLKRAFAAQVLLGGPDRHLHDLGDLLDIPGPDEEYTA